jgi:hypothetical protein
LEKENMIRLARLAIAAMAVVAPLAADFSYKTDMKVTGGAMAGAMRMATRMSKTARSAMEGSTHVKGNKMAMVTGDSVTVMDLDAGTVTTIEHSRKQYSVMTFEEYRQGMEQLAQKARGKKDDLDVKYAVKIRDGGKKQDVNGFPASLTIFTLQVDASDSKGSRTSVDMVNDMWLSKGIAGSDELSAFNKRAAEKMTEGFGAPTLGAMGAMIQQQGGTQALREFQENASKLEGVPVLTVIRVGQAGSANAMASSAGQLPDEKAEAESGRPSVGGMLRGMGGLGGRRSGNQQEAEAPSGGSGSILEMAMKAYDFSTAPIPDSQFTVPAGYKEVESDLQKALR